MTITYAIGDIHGRADLLIEMVQRIDSHAAGENYEIIFLGDLIDRGPESRKAMEVVLDVLKEVPGSKLILGNHEELFLTALAAKGDDRLKRLQHWSGPKVGGLATLASYGFQPDDSVDCIVELMESQFARHLAAMRNAENMVIRGDCVFVHAGILPGIPLGDQNERDLRWIRDEFLDCREPHEKFVVHGHTPTEDGKPDRRPNRLNIDTGAYVSGILTAVAVPPEGGDLEILTTVP